jgi:glycosyltransferase involved in cell wall biosynthesis
MRVAFLTGSVSRTGGGFFESVRGLARALRDHNDVEVTVFGLADEYADRDLAEWEPVKVKAFPVRGPRAFGWAPGLARAVTDFEPDLVHLHGLWMYTSVVARSWGRASARPVVIAPRGMLDAWAMRHSRWKKRAAALLFERTNLRQAGCLHALCDAEREAIRRFGLANPVSTVPNGVEIPQEDDDPPPWAGRVRNGKKVLLFLGRLHPKKNLINLVRSWATVAGASGRGAGGWELVIMGWDQTGYGRQIRGVVAREAIPAVHVLDPVFGRERDAALHHACAFVLASLGEGLPMTVLEAWAHGVPVLMTPECNLPEGFAEHAALRIGSDIEGIGDGIRSLVAMDESKRRELGKRGLDLVRRQFTWGSVGRKNHDVYRWLLEGGMPPPCLDASSSVTSNPRGG